MNETGTHVEDYDGSSNSLTIRMVAGFAEVIEKEEFLVAEAYHPNCWVLPFHFPMVRTEGNLAI